jgi:6-methylsalicylate decarboxylase
VRVDIHQHLWPPPLLEALAMRTVPPRLRRTGSGWVVQLRGEPDAPVCLDDHDPARRAALLAADGVDRGLVAVSSPLGIEALPLDESAWLIDAYHRGLSELPSGLGGWAAVSLSAPDLPGLAELLDRGLVGATVPAAAVGSRAGLERCAPILDALERHHAAAFIHPGPAPWAPNPARGASCEPWWPAMTTYVAQMTAAWHAWHAYGRAAHPHLRVVFAMLAGLAPLHGERFRARAGTCPPIDAGVFLDTSSYGVRALDACLRVVGVDALVYGSDRPVVDPAAPDLGPAVNEALRIRNPARLLARSLVAA